MSIWDDHCGGQGEEPPVVQRMRDLGFRYRARGECNECRLLDKLLFSRRELDWWRCSACIEREAAHDAASDNHTH